MLRRSEILFVLLALGCTPLQSPSPGTWACVGDVPVYYTEYGRPWRASEPPVRCAETGTVCQMRSGRASCLPRQEAP